MSISDRDCWLVSWSKINPLRGGADFTPEGERAPYRCWNESNWVQSTPGKPQQLWKTKTSLDSKNTVLGEESKIKGLLLPPTLYHEILHVEDEKSTMDKYDFVLAIKVEYICRKLVRLWERFWLYLELYIMREDAASVIFFCQRRCPWTNTIGHTIQLQTYLKAFSYPLTDSYSWYCCGYVGVFSWVSWK